MVRPSYCHHAQLAVGLVIRLPRTPVGATDRRALVAHPSSGSREADIAAGWAAAVHELRSTTCIIKGFADTMATRWDDAQPDELLEMLARLRRNADRLKRLVESLLVDARTDAGELDLALAGTKFDAAIDAATDVATARGLAVDVSGAMSITAHADPYRVEQILLTLVDNACRHGTPPIEISTKSDHTRVAIIVHDHGRGVADAEAQHLFDRFSPGSRASDSNGLGLYTARGLARAMGGDLAYENGKGSTFSLTLPRAGG